ncbi:hypothetical protein BV898_13738 [Hypsibius exemplaris]|uniref:Uncharacterized protein n=1 Tax=Hypsibius exemplaris TaxID=2072580 RepID=A0A1W0W9V3_HYPEX|nr:hypothetical protein BV898_13738 [Hypsibius exemplaris]
MRNGTENHGAQGGLGNLQELLPVRDKLKGLAVASVILMIVELLDSHMALIREEEAVQISCPRSAPKTVTANFPNILLRLGDVIPFLHLVDFDPFLSSLATGWPLTIF